MQDLEEFVNDEQLLALAFSVLVRDPENQVAADIVLCYCINKLGGVALDIEVEKLYGDLFEEYVRDMLVKEGMGERTFDEDGVHYTFTPEGQQCLFALIKARYNS